MSHSLKCFVANLVVSIFDISHHSSVIRMTFSTGTEEHATTEVYNQQTDSMYSYWILLIKPMVVFVIGITWNKQPNKIRWSRNKTRIILLLQYD